MIDTKVNEQVDAELAQACGVPVKDLFKIPKAFIEGKLCGLNSTAEEQKNDQPIITDQVRIEQAQSLYNILLVLKHTPEDMRLQQVRMERKVIEHHLKIAEHDTVHKINFPISYEGVEGSQGVWISTENQQPIYTGYMGLTQSYSTDQESELGLAATEYLDFKPFGHYQPALDHSLDPVKDQALKTYISDLHPHREPKVSFKARQSMDYESRKKAYKAIARIMKKCIEDKVQPTSQVCFDRDRSKCFEEEENPKVMRTLWGNPAIEDHPRFNPTVAYSKPLRVVSSIYCRADKTVGMDMLPTVIQQTHAMKTGEWSRKVLLYMQYFTSEFIYRQFVYAWRHEGGDYQIESIQRLAKNLLLRHNHDYFYWLEEEYVKDKQEKEEEERMLRNHTWDAQNPDAGKALTILEYRAKHNTNWDPQSADGKTLKLLQEAREAGKKPNFKIRLGKRTKRAEKEEEEKKEEEDTKDRITKRKKGSSEVSILLKAAENLDYTTTKQSS